MPSRPPLVCDRLPWPESGRTTIAGRSVAAVVENQKLENFPVFRAGFEPRLRVFEETGSCLSRPGRGDVTEKLRQVVPPALCFPNDCVGFSGIAFPRPITALGQPHRVDRQQIVSPLFGLGCGPPSPDSDGAVRWRKSVVGLFPVTGRERSVFPMCWPRIPAIVLSSRGPCR